MRIILTIAFAGILASCTNGENNSAGQLQEPSSSDAAMPNDSIRFFSYETAKPVENQPAPTHHLAKMTGILVNINNCVVLKSGDRNFALVFQAGSAKAGKDSVSFLIDGQEFTFGQKVSAGGSGGSATIFDDADLAKKECGADDVWLVNPASLQPEK